MENMEMVTETVVTEEKVEKKTKVEQFTEIKSLLESVEGTEDLVAFVDAQIASIESRAAKAKARKEAAKAEAVDTLKDAVAAVLTNDYQDIDAILAAIDSEEASRAKVVNRLTKLVNEGVAVKEAAKVDSRKVICYKLA